MFRLLKWRKKERVQAALVAAAILRNPSGEILLVQKDNNLTLPTGHMDPAKDADLEETLLREIKEELGVDRSEVEIIGSFGTMVRNKDSPAVSKSIEIFSCRISRKAALLAEFEEKGEKGQLWVRPSQIKNLTLLDELVREALQRYQEKYAARQKGEKSETARKNFQDFGYKRSPTGA
jgi:ADP-ribose pyrophosphatase YjhB (NUDIX family)